MEDEYPEGLKFDEGKLPLDLLPIDSLYGTTRVLAFGAEKYEPYNWAKGMAYSRLVGAALRHIYAFWGGEKLDPETEEHHLAHASCCIMFLLHYELNRERYEQFDDSPREVYSPDQHSARPGDAEEALSGTCRLSREDFKSVVPSLSARRFLPSEIAEIREILERADLLEPSGSSAHHA